MSYVRHELESVVGSEDENGPKYTASYLVTVDDPRDKASVVINSMPWRLYQVYQIGNDYDPRAFVLSANATPIKSNNYRWAYVVEFGTPASSDNPFDEPPQVEIVFAQGEKLIERDINGKAIRNTVGDRFDDVLTREDSQPILRLTRNEQNALDYMSLRDTVNRTTWMGAARRTVKFQPPTLRSRYHKQYGTYYEKSFEMKFSDETWRFILLNQGYYELKAGATSGAPKKRIRIKDGDGNDITTPIALTHAGAKLGDTDPPVWLEFDGYREAQFPDFGINL